MITFSNPSGGRSDTFTFKLSDNTNGETDAATGYQGLTAGDVARQRGRSNVMVIVRRRANGNINDYVPVNTPPGGGWDASCQIQAGDLVQISQSGVKGA